LYRFRLTISYVCHVVTIECTSGVVNLQERRSDKL